MRSAAGALLQEVERISSPDEADELDRFAVEQRPALWGVEGGPPKGPFHSRQPPVQPMELLEVAASRGDQQGGQLR